MYIFKWHNLGPVSAILLLAIAVVSCRGETPVLPSPPASSPAPTMQPTPSRTKIIETPTTLASPPTCLSGGQVEERAREALAKWLGVSSEEIGVVKVEEVEWPDTSLGCPEPGMVYAQVIVPGWKVVMRVDGEVYEYHSGGRHGVLCDQEGHLISVVPSPTVPPIAVPGTPTPTREDVCPMMLVFPHGRVCPTPRTPHD